MYVIIENLLDVIIEVCYAYISYLRDPKFYDMISTKGDNKYGEEGVAEPSLNALHYRLTSYLAAVLHNPETRIMKPKLKRIFAKLEEHYGDYMKSLSGTRYKIVKKFIESL